MSSLYGKCRIQHIGLQFGGRAGTVGIDGIEIQRPQHDTIRVNVHDISLRNQGGKITVLAEFPRPLQGGNIHRPVASGNGIGHGIMLILEGVVGVSMEPDHIGVCTHQLDKSPPLLRGFGDTMGIGEERIRRPIQVVVLMEEHKAPLVPVGLQRIPEPQELILSIPGGKEQIGGGGVFYTASSIRNAIVIIDMDQIILAEGLNNELTLFVMLPAGNPRITLR